MIQRIGFLFLMLASAMTIADNSTPPYIIAHGIAEKNVKPETAKIDIALFSYRQNSDDALQDVNKATDKIINILADNDVGGKALEASNFLKETI